MFILKMYIDVYCWSLFCDISFLGQNGSYKIVESVFLLDINLRKYTIPMFIINFFIYLWKNECKLNSEWRNMSISNL